MEETPSAALPFHRRERAKWAIPAGFFIVALLLQNMAMASTTASYVQWMDSIRGGLISNKTEHGNVTDRRHLNQFVLADVFVHGSRQHSTLLVESATVTVGVIWMGWTIRRRDLENWTRTMLAAGLCSCLKAAIAWTTVLPDAAGWAACEARLGTSGLSYYRQYAASLWDALMLELGSLRSFASPQQSTFFCADTLFSFPVSLCVIVSMGFYGCLQSAVPPIATCGSLDPRLFPELVCSVSGVLLALLVAGQMVLAIQNAYHYTADVIVGALLALLVYGNPAIALAARQWSSSMTNRVSMAWPLAEALLGRASPIDESAAADQDFGAVDVLSCCAPLCALGGTYYLRGQPECNDSPRRGDPLQEQRQRLAQFQIHTSELKMRHGKLAAEIARVRSRDSNDMGSPRRATEKQLQKEKIRLDKEADEAIAEACRRLGLEAASPSLVASPSPSSLLEPPSASENPFD